MASTYTDAGLEIIADGEKAGSWGSITSTNLQLLEQMTSRAVSITLSGTTHTLTVSDGSLASEGQYAVLVFGGSPSGTNTVTISPNDAKRVYFVLNSSGESIALTQGSGGNVTVANGVSAVVYCDGAGSGAAVVDISSTFAVADAGLQDIAALAVTDGNIIVGDGANWVAESGAIARTSLGLGTTDNPQFATIELGAATDTTLSRTGAGVIAVEGVEVTMNSATQTVTNKSVNLASNTLTGTTAEFNTALSDGSFVTLAGTETLTNKTLTTPTLTGTAIEDVYDLGTPGATPAIDPANGSIQTMTLSENATPTDSITAGQGLTLMVDDGASAYTVTWTSLVNKWIGGSAPTLPTSGYAVIVLWKIETTVYASYVGDMS